MERTFTMDEYEHATVDREAETALSLDEASTVPRDEQTEARPHLLTLYYPTNTPASFTDKFPKQRLRKHGNQAFEMGRGQTVDVLLNDTHMPRSFVEINCAVHLEDGPKWYIKNKSNKKPVRIVCNKVRSTLKHEEKQELVENCEVKLELLTFVVRIEDGDVGDLTEVELEILPMENDSTTSSGSVKSLNRQTSSSDDSAYSLTSASALLRNRAGSGPAALQTTNQNGVVGVQLPGNCFGLPLTGHGALPGSTPVHRLIQPVGNASAAGSQCSTYCPNYPNNCSHNFQHPGSQYSHPQINHIMNPSSASSQVSHLTNPPPQANMLFNPMTGPGYASPGSGPPGHYVNPGVGYPMAGGYPQVINQHPYYQGQPGGFPHFPNQQPLPQNGGHSQLINQPPSNQPGFSQLPNQEPLAQNGGQSQMINQPPSNQAGFSQYPNQQPLAQNGGHSQIINQPPNQAGFSQFPNQQPLAQNNGHSQMISHPHPNQYPGAPSLNPQAPASQQQVGLPHQQPPAPGHPAVYPQGQSQLQSHQPSLRTGVVESQQTSTAAVNIIMTGVPYAMPELQGTSLQPTTSALNYPELSQHPSEYSQRLLSQHTVIRADDGQHLPQPLHGPQSMPLSTLGSQAHRLLPPSHELSSQGQHNAFAHAVQPESAMHIQQPGAPPIISVPTTHDRHPQLYYTPDGGLPVAPPTMQLEELKLGYPVQVTMATPTEVSSTTPANSLAHSSGANSLNHDGGGGASVISLNPSYQQASGPRVAPGFGASQNGGTESDPSASARGAATESSAEGAQPAVAVSSLTNPASNGNSVNLRVHEAVAATPPTSMGSLGVQDLALGLQHGSTDQGQGQGHRSQGQTQNRQPQENDDRQPQEHDDQES